MSDYDPPLPALRSLVATALAEDLGVLGDITSLACVPPGARASAAFVARAPGVLAGTAAVSETYRQVDPAVEVTWQCHDGGTVEPGSVLGCVHGTLRSVLAGERVALNLLTHASGVATLTRRFVDAAGPGVRIRDTRKTLPGLRALQKAAVRAGGGANHRDSLSDAVLVKDNHLAVSSVTDAVARARDRWPGRVVEVECDTLDQVREAGDAGAHLVLVDNMSPDDVAEAVRLLAGRAEVEVSGGVTLDNVAAYAAAGPAYIAVGALTHSAPVLDVGLDVAPDAG